MEILRSIKEKAILVPAIFAKSLLTATLVAGSAEALNLVNNQTLKVEAISLEQSTPIQHEDNTNWVPLFIICGSVSVVLVTVAIATTKDD